MVRYDLQPEDFTDKVFMEDLFQGSDIVDYIEEFQIPTLEKTEQQAIRLTPDIKARIR